MPPKLIKRPARLVQRVKLLRNAAKPYLVVVAQPHKAEVAAVKDGKLKQYLLRAWDGVVV